MNTALVPVPKLWSTGHLLNLMTMCPGLLQAAAAHSHNPPSPWREGVAEAGVGYQERKLVCLNFWLIAHNLTGF